MRRKFIESNLTETKSIDLLDSGIACNRIKRENIRNWDQIIIFFLNVQDKNKQKKGNT